MIVLILLIVAATLLGAAGVYCAIPPRSEYPRGIAYIAWAIIAVALAFWHGST